MVVIFFRQKVCFYSTGYTLAILGIVLNFSLVVFSTQVLHMHSFTCLKNHVSSSGIRE